MFLNYIEYPGRLVANTLLLASRRHAPFPPRRLLAPVHADRTGLFLVHITGQTERAVKNAFIARSWLARGTSPERLDQLRFRLSEPLLYMGVATVPGKNGERVALAVGGVPYLTPELVDTAHPHHSAACESIVRMGRFLKQQHPDATALGLGAANSIAHKGGLETAAKLADIETVTSGNALTVFALSRQVTDLPVRFRGNGGLVRDKTLAIIGAAGSIGSRLTEYLAHYHMFNTIYGMVILVGRPDVQPEEDKRLLALKSVLEQHRVAVILTNDRELAHQQADVVVVTTNEGGTRLPDLAGIVSGQIIIDTNEPASISPNLEHFRPDVLVVSGARVVMPSLAWPMGRMVGYYGNVVPACFGELYLHAAGYVDGSSLPSRRPFVGAFTQEAIQRVQQAFEVSPLRFAEPHGADRRPIPDERLNAYEEAVSANQRKRTISSKLVVHS